DTSPSSRHNVPIMFDHGNGVAADKKVMNAEDGRRATCKRPETHLLLFSPITGGYQAVDRLIKATMAGAAIRRVEASA
ncbi:MAG: hypothetical protein WAV02_09505, partial [Stellaceae bacterium]